MSENDKIPFKLTQKESFIGKQHPDKVEQNDSEDQPYPNQEKTEGADSLSTTRTGTELTQIQRKAEINRNG